MALRLERAGMQPRWFIEIDGFCRSVLKKHWPDVKQYGDIRKLGGEELEQVDVVAAGPPCQPVSYAGKGLGEADQRWLWPDLFRVVRAVRPRHVILENPPALLRRGLGHVLRELAEGGFDAEWQVLAASQFGAPHSRERLYILAYAAGEHGTPWRGLDEGAERRSPLESGGLSGLAVAERRKAANAWLASEPRVGRLADGIPDQVERLEALGNAMVPQVAEYIGRHIMAFDAARREAGT